MIKFLMLLAEAPDFKAPADYIGGIVLAVIGAFGGLGFIVAAGAMIWILVQKQIAAAAGNQKKKDECTKNLITIVIAMIVLGIAVPLCGVFAASLIGTDMGLTKSALIVLSVVR
ncbi:hypothetical protein EELLY_v1c03710 [Entomoplasma ellychniae]|uniref:Uncharacterized protein n=1 Tax=Entomoplasma ellychniae TaxID=2114 RepID=A0A8E2QWS2_9MOLU|nr:hypothetical protein [Entomoplasma ellychniae]PPE04348.1 hypothetical protein EELLY_v1c00220 [Entomoplasma ellychniae]PPE04620.1 hypothetical protein EELLY_v1c03000 [Entomoplasma ellychniae]PPE04691.1 hypothetical protein EELLY_v1c03710 [Entomoplasma ellychniae]